MQPDAKEAPHPPKGPLEWGQINFLHTTDTHGWLEGHIKEENYGADWGDFVSFVAAMKCQAQEYGVDLLLIDTGDLHDGAGLSDATAPNGQLSNPIFQNIDYDLLTIGNHELYVTEIAYEHFNQFAKVYGDRYLTSNVKILNPANGQFEYIGKQYRYFTTEHGLRIMAFGFIFDFDKNSNVSKVIKADEVLKEQWFQDALNFDQPIDMFVVIGHNAARTTDKTSTMGKYYGAIRDKFPDTPIQIFGGHTHKRDFVVYDNKATAIESGRYCETLGWISIAGLEASKAQQPPGIPGPSRPAEPVEDAERDKSLPQSKTPSSQLYSRRYLDWNRLTFAYHADRSQDTDFDTQQGRAVTATITGVRSQLNLTRVIGCAPRTYCIFCKPFGTDGSIYKLLEEALSKIVVNEERKDTPRIIFVNTGSIRFDLVQGPFTYDDSFIVSPFENTFKYIPDVPWDQAKTVLDTMNAGPYQKRSLDLTPRDFGFNAMSLVDQEECVDPPVVHEGLVKRGEPNRLTRRSDYDPTPGYVTKDDFGEDGDDTPHVNITAYPLPNDVQANASFPTDGTLPDKVDVIYLNFIEKYVVGALNRVGAKYTAKDAKAYLPDSFKSNQVIPKFAELEWKANIDNCPVNKGVGYDKRRL
ncbi:Metallo-dependent phosphatase-like protein [Phyllosticta citrichinensis]|uniref:Metallo-dependent phosphatase-like protein n=1 Tax=Phyllosticta citrichinensis TaxID=1130410 RepID=A0ABR1XI43_9PEZI